MRLPQLLISVMGKPAGNASNYNNERKKEKRSSNMFRFFYF